MMIEILRQLKNQAMLWIRIKSIKKTAERFFAFKQPNVQYHAKESKLAWETTLTQSRIVSINIFLNYFHHFAK